MSASANWPVLWPNRSSNAPSGRRDDRRILYESRSLEPDSRIVRFPGRRDLAVAALPGAGRHRIAGSQQRRSGRSRTATRRSQGRDRRSPARAGYGESEAQSIRARGERDAQALRERILAASQERRRAQVRNAEGELDRGRRARAGDLARRTDRKARIEIARESAAKLDDGTNRRLVGEVVETLERGGAA